MELLMLQGTVMNSLRTLVLCTFASISAAATAEPLSGQPPAAAAEAAESVHVQPRGNGFNPRSVEDDAVQKRITIFNEMQGLQDASFDRKLTICRRC
jgi:hypothetical protein